MKMKINLITLVLNLGAVFLLATSWPSLPSLVLIGPNAVCAIVNFSILYIWIGQINDTGHSGDW